MKRYRNIKTNEILSPSSYMSIPSAEKQDWVEEVETTTFHELVTIGEWKTA